MVEGVDLLIPFLYILMSTANSYFNEPTVTDRRTEGKSYLKRSLNIVNWASLYVIKIPSFVILSSLSFYGFFLFSNFFLLFLRTSQRVVIQDQFSCRQIHSSLTNDFP